MKIPNWAFQWKISVNPDPIKQQQKVALVGKYKSCHADKVSNATRYFPRYSVRLYETSDKHFH